MWSGRLDSAPVESESASDAASLATGEACTTASSASWAGEGAGGGSCGRSGCGWSAICWASGEGGGESGSTGRLHCGGATTSQISRHLSEFDSLRVKRIGARGHWSAREEG